jgi:hypothetical protein
MSRGRLKLQAELAEIITEEVRSAGQGKARRRMIGVTERCHTSAVNILGYIFIQLSMLTLCNWCCIFEFQLVEEQFEARTAVIMAAVNLIR